MAGTCTQHIGTYKSLLVGIEIGITSMEVLIEIKNAHIKIPIAGQEGVTGTLLTFTPRHSSDQM